MPNGFSGHLMVLHEIYKQGFNPEKFFQKTIFVGHNVEKIVEKVLNGEVDGGIIRTCYWEEYAVDRHNIDKNLIRVVDAKRFFSCLSAHLGTFSELDYCDDAFGKPRDRSKGS